MKAKFIYPFLIISLMLLNGCKKTVDIFSILAADAFYSDTNYQDALSLYMRIAENNMDPGKNDIISLNVATTFAAMGEERAAMHRFEILTESPNPEVSSNAYFASGLILFGQNDWYGAEKNFRDSLRKQPGSIDAAKYLEASINAARTKSNAGEKSVSTVSIESGEGNEILELTARMEVPLHNTEKTTNQENQEVDL